MGGARAPVRGSPERVVRWRRTEGFPYGARRARRRPPEPRGERRRFVPACPLLVQLNPPVVRAELSRPHPAATCLQRAGGTGPDRRCRSRMSDRAASVGPSIACLQRVRGMAKAGGANLAATGGTTPAGDGSPDARSRAPGPFCMSWRLVLLGGGFLVALAATWVYVVERARGAPVDVTTALLTQLPLTVPTLMLAPGVAWMARRFPVDLERWKTSLAAHSIGLLLMISIHGSLTSVGMRWLAPEQTGGLTGLDLFWSLTSGLFYLWVLVYLGLAGVVHAYDYFWRSRDREQKADRLETRLLEAQLASLRGRLQPHFLFNSLQAVAGLVDEDPNAARSMLARLGDLLRASLTSSRRHFVPLDEEVAFVTDYLDIQATRFRDRLTTVVDVPDELGEVRVPSFVLQPLVENALRHGISPRVRPGTVELLARRDGGSLVLAVRDDGGGETPDPPDTWSEGVGLSSTRQRLEALYGERHRMDIRRREGGGVEVELRLPLAGSGTDT